MTGDALSRALLAGKQKTVRMLRIKIVTASPLTVTLPDGSTVPGLAVTGLTYTINGAGVALLAEGSIPVILPTA